MKPESKAFFEQEIWDASKQRLTQSRDADGLERWFECLPAFDLRETDWDVGAHVVEMRWYLRGPRGMVSWDRFTGWPLPPEEITGEDFYKFRSYYETRSAYGDHALNNMNAPIPAALRTHSVKPEFEGHERHECGYVIGQDHCYPDITYTGGERLFERLVREGNIGVFAALKDYYENLGNTEA
jgi:hypothetical protein